MFGLNNPQFPILTIFVVVIIAAYNSHTINAVLQYEPPSVNIVDKVKTAIAMVYPTMKGGEEWFMGPNLQNDKRFEANANLSENQDDIWSVDSTGQTTLNIWTNG
jgi:hypothetical protein